MSGRVETKKLLSTVVLVITGLLSWAFVIAHTASTTPEQQRQNEVDQLNTQKGETEKKLGLINAQIKSFTQQIATAQNQANTLKNQISIFDKEIATTQLQIEAKQTQIDDTQTQIDILQKLIEQ